MIDLLSDLEVSWKKRAASAAAGQEDVEKAFLDQAYISLQNRATPIMKAPYRVGFEIVFKNEDNTRMVGIFIFRVGKEMYYAPVFFLNGLIKGTDLFYKASTKSFVPLTNDWVEYLINVNPTSEGQGVNVSERNQSRDRLNLSEIIEPPRMRKFAMEAWAGMQETREAALPGSLMRRFIQEDGGASAIAKLASAIQRSPEFAEALVLSVGEENFNPELGEVKQASAPEPALILHTGLLDNDSVKQASVEDLAKGYRFEDFRKEATLSPVYEESSMSIENVSEPAVYDLLMEDGTRRPILVGYEAPDAFKRACGSCRDHTRSHDRSLVMVDLESKHSREVHDVKSIFGDLKEEITDKLGEAVPSEGKAYRILNLKDKSLSRPFKVKSAKTEHGLTHLELLDGHFNGDTTRAYVNTDYDGHDPVENIFGKCCRFIEVAVKAAKEGATTHGWIDYERDIPVGNKHALNDFIFGQGYKRAAVAVRANGAVVVNTDGRWSQEMSKLAATAGIMVKFNTDEAAAEDLLKKASGRCGKAVGFYYQPAAVKYAYNLQMNDWPEPDQEQNSDFGIMMEPDTHRLMQVQQDEPDHQVHRIGDAYRQETGDTVDQILDTAGPMGLYEHATERGVNTLFEHGVVGELVDTYDSISLVDKYIPDMERALDGIGRTLFLFYWKPEDFVKAFGSDDQSQLENKLVSNFKSFGDLVLELMQKTKAREQGTVSLPS